MKENYDFSDGCVLEFSILFLFKLYSFCVQEFALVTFENLTFQIKPSLCNLLSGDNPFYFYLADCTTPCKPSILWHYTDDC